MKNEIKAVFKDITSKESLKFAGMMVLALLYVYQPMIVAGIFGTYNKTLFITGYTLPVIGVVSLIITKAILSYKKEI